MNNKCWGIVPAAGIGQRMGQATPKQYLELAGKTLIEWSLGRLLSCSAIENIVVAVQSGDDRWERLACRHNPKIKTVKGGAERSDSVYAGLLALEDQADPDDWVLVHDAVRPCVTAASINSLLDSIHGHNVGGLLAFPMRETLKKVDQQDNVIGTLNRSELWAAQTPQVFRYSVLKQGLDKCQEENIPVTDESMAVEALGLKPKVVLGSVDNIKITWPEDLTLAALILLVQGKGGN